VTRLSGTVADPALDVTWLADADLPASEKFGLKIAQNGAMPYGTALQWVHRLNAYDHHRGWLGHDDWTLPVTPTPLSDPACDGYNGSGAGSFGFGCVTSPFGSLYSTMFGLQAPATAVAIHDEPTGPFHDFQPYLYWTGVQTPRHLDGYATFSFNTGQQGSNISKDVMYVLPVVPGDPFGSPSSAPLDPSADGATVFEPGVGAHGVTWLADADLARTDFLDTAGIADDGAMAHDTAVTWVSRLNGSIRPPQGLWQLPTPQELAQLDAALKLPAGEPVVPTPRVDLSGFADVQPYLYWSCAGRSVDGSCSGAPKPSTQWSFSFGNGFQGTTLKGNLLYVAVYYPNPNPTPTPTHQHPTCKPGPPGKPITCQ
jgi:hypothetical protein